MLNGKKVIIFDMDGTLIDSVGIWNRVDVELIKRIGGVQISEEDAQAQRDSKLREFASSENPYINYCRYLGSKYDSDLSAEDIHTIRYDIADYFLENVIDYKKDADKAMKMFKEKGLELVIATTTGKNNMNIYRHKNKNLINKAPIDEYFSLIYCREDVTQIKPNPEVYLKVIKTLGVKAEECLVFEDSISGVEAAKNAGIEVVAVYDRYSHNDWERIAEISDYHIMDYTELKFEE